MNNRPLTYMEEDVEQPTLTPNSMLFTTPNYIPELKAYHEVDPDLRKRTKFLKLTKEHANVAKMDERVRAIVTRATSFDGSVEG